MNLRSGKDTSLRGATVSVPRVVADVVRNLNIENLQDTSAYHSDQKSIGGSIAVGAGKPSGNVSYNSGKVDSNSLATMAALTAASQQAWKRDAWRWTSLHWARPQPAPREWWRSRPRLGRG